MKLACVKNFNLISEAGLAKNLLKEYRIVAIVKKHWIEFPGGYFGDSTGASLFVAERDFYKTMDILNSMQCQ